MVVHHIDLIVNLVNSGNLQGLEYIMNRLADTIANEIIKGLK